jgi:hypothetical protein
MWLIISYIYFAVLSWNSMFSAMICFWAPGLSMHTGVGMIPHDVTPAEGTRMER